MAAFPNAVLHRLGRLARRPASTAPGSQDAENDQGRGPRGHARRRARVVLDEDNQILDPATRRRGRPAGPRRARAARLLQGPGEVRAHVHRGRRRALLACPATSPASRPTARSRCSAAARTASTPAARRSTPRRSRWRSRPTPTSTTRWSSASPTSSSASAVAAVVQPRGEQPARPRRAADVPARRSSSGYKLPRSVTYVDEIPRSADRQGRTTPGPRSSPGRRPRPTAGARCAPTLCDAVRHRVPDLRASPRPSTSPRRSAGPAGSACWAACASTTPTSSSGR